MVPGRQVSIVVFPRSTSRRILICMSLELQSSPPPKSADGKAQANQAGDRAGAGDGGAGAGCTPRKTIGNSCGSRSVGSHRFQCIMELGACAH